MSGGRAERAGGAEGGQGCGKRELPQRVPQPDPAAGPFHGGRPSAAPAKDFGAGPLGLRRRRLLFTLTNRAGGSIISFTDAKCESVWMQ